LGVKSTTRVVEVPELLVGEAAPNRRRAARLAAAGHAGVDHGAIVGPVTGRLHDNVAGESEVIAQSEELRLARVARGVLALGNVRELGPGAEDVAMRVDAAAR
jgi:hypothetical protein